jgi:hypothetical protein
MFHPRAIEAANDLIKLWSLKAPKLGQGQFFEASDDLMVSLPYIDSANLPDVVSFPTVLLDRKSFPYT